MSTSTDLFDLSGTVALVTGGAKGLGLAMAKGLADHGSDIALADIDDSTGEKAAAELSEATGRTVRYYHCNVMDPAEVDALVDRVVADLGKIDTLLNNAGRTIHQPLEEVTEENWRAVMGLNLDAVFHVMQSVARHMLERGSGSIINTGSMSGIIANIPQKQASYNASKAAVHNLTRSAACEWAERGLRVNAIAPGYMRTELTRGFYEEGGPQIDQWNLMTPMKRPGEPHELAGAAVFLASQASTFVTGSILSVDGGYTAA
ncbi:SDR family oxidoreductase [Brachybacterium halotolerans subsp. kimchii]|uniref:glucose 1-dehydrogenase n=1 Tax=Brachybacterium halotolerans TaxID=2795215 RepID=UPI001E5DCE58|nr:glucose 1-dehydrogenase [Brachybacterium halotolerans]UEJ84441.1 SDR family oxidoreductase [Brachybacterium halotolerans subsp. kimchii]